MLALRLVCCLYYTVLNTRVCNFVHSSQVMMACIKDPHVVDSFRAAMEEVYSRLLVQTSGEMTEGAVELGQSHRQTMKSAAGRPPRLSWCNCNVTIVFVGRNFTINCYYRSCTCNITLNIHIIMLLLKATSVSQ